MIKNYFYLIAGLLCVLSAFTHAWNGETAVLPVFDNMSIETGTKTMFHYIWHIITVENLLFGSALFCMAFYKNLSNVKFTAWVIASIMLVRWIVILWFTIVYDKTSISQILPDSIAIFILVALLLLGTRVKNKSENATARKQPV